MRTLLTAIDFDGSVAATTGGTVLAAGSGWLWVRTDTGSVHICDLRGPVGPVTIRVQEVPDVPTGTTVALDLAAARERPKMELPPPGDPVALDEWCERLRPFCWDDATAAQLDVASPEVSVDALIGRGPGLTPAGDDVLCGYVVACRAQHPQLGDRVAHLIDQATDRTGEPSRSLLRAAVSGQLFADAMRLLTHMLEGRPEHLGSDLRRLTALGQTTGRALLSGIVGAVRSRV